MNRWAIVCRPLGLGEIHAAMAQSVAWRGRFAGFERLTHATGVRLSLSGLRGKPFPGR
jgi:hypothetical protein